MERIKIYFDTTIPNYKFNIHVPDKQEAVKKLLNYIKLKGYDVYISSVVIREIQETKNTALRNKFLNNG